MREMFNTIKAMGVKGIVDWFKRLFLAISLLEFIGYSVYWLITVGILSKLVLIAIPVTAVVIAAIETVITDEEKEEIEEVEEIEET